MPSALDLLLDAADKAAGPHTGDGGDDDLDALGLEEVAATTVSEGGAIFVDGGTVLLCIFYAACVLPHSVETCGVHHWLGWVVPRRGAGHRGSLT